MPSSRMGGSGAAGRYTKDTRTTPRRHNEWCLSSPQAGQPSLWCPGSQPSSAVREVPLGRQGLVFFESQAYHGHFGCEGRGQLVPDPADERFARRVEAPGTELGQRRVEMLVVEAIDHQARYQGIEPSQVGDEACQGVELAAQGHEEPVVVAVARQVGALAEASPVLLVGPFGSAVQMAGTEPVSGFEPEAAAAAYRLDAGTLRARLHRPGARILRPRHGSRPFPRPATAPG